MNNTLYVATCVFNPNNSDTLERLCAQFCCHMRDTKGVELHLVKLFQSDVVPFNAKNPFAWEKGLGKDHRERHVFSKNILFHKENLLNLAIQGFPDDWQYGAILDADLHFSNPDWATHTVQLLKEIPFIQPFDRYLSVSGQSQADKGQKLEDRTSFGAQYVHGPSESYNWDIEHGQLSKEEHAPYGLAWAFTREAYEAIGGFYDKGILGNGDRVFVDGLTGTIHKNLEATFTQDYADTIKNYQEKVFNYAKGHISYTPGTVTHYWHGSKRSRQYFKRNLILQHHQYEPSKDVRYNEQGVLELTGNKPEFQQAIELYFHDRREDETYVAK